MYLHILLELLVFKIMNAFAKLVRTKTPWKYVFLFRKMTFVGASG